MCSLSHDLNMQVEDPLNSRRCCNMYNVKWSTHSEPVGISGESASK